MAEPLFGVDYYPEHWDEERWPVDAALMREAGMNTVRLGEFAWSRMEPRAGEFDFGWLDRAIEVLAAAGLRVILGTPTAAPPAWLIEAAPEILPVNEYGQPATFGVRRHYCPSQPAFHEATRRIVGALAEHYDAHPAVFAWQIDNEFGSIANGRRCHCPVCRATFQQWLKQRYGSLEELNRCWGTVFWSQEYTNWLQVPLPMQELGMASGGSTHNPGLYLDFARWTSENLRSYQHVQVEILRGRCPHHILTHNMMGFFPTVDYAALAQDLDIVSWDNYPRLPAVWSPFGGNYSPAHVAAAHDIMRGVKRHTYWVMEQQSGPTGWGMLSPSPLPGELRLWTMQAVARGAEGIVYFRWRTARVGTEQYWHGILGHDGSTGRRYDEIRRTGEDMRRLGAVVRSPLPSEVGIVRSYETLWAFEAQPTAVGLSYDDQIGRYHRALWRRNVLVDIVTEDAWWDGYKLLIAPCLFVLRENVSARLRAWVEAGGTLVLTFRTGVKDRCNAVVNAALPGLVSDLAGVEVADYTALLPEGAGNPCGGHERLELDLGSGSTRIGAGIWMDALTTRGASVWGRYRGEPYDGEAGITTNDVGSGHVVYVGTSLDDAGQDILMDKLLTVAGVRAGVAAAEGMEIVRRVHEGTEHWFVLNHTAMAQEVTLPAPGTNVLSGAAVERTFTVAGRDVAVVRRGTE